MGPRVGSACASIGVPPPTAELWLAASARRVLGSQAPVPREGAQDAPSRGEGVPRREAEDSLRSAPWPRLALSSLCGSSDLHLGPESRVSRPILLRTQKCPLVGASCSTDTHK